MNREAHFELAQPGYMRGSYQLSSLHSGSQLKHLILSVVKNTRAEIAAMKYAIADTVVPVP